MTFKEYQEESRGTVVYPREYRLAYPALGLAGEAGEVAEKMKKVLRDDHGEVTDSRREEIKKELGDVLWYIAQLCTELELTMEEVAELNLSKLRSRMDRGQLRGSGDNR